MSEARQLTFDYLRDQCEKIEAEIEKTEERLEELENTLTFSKEFVDPRYKRLADKCEMLTKNLCAIRIKMGEFLNSTENTNNGSKKDGTASTHSGSTGSTSSSTSSGNKKKSNALASGNQKIPARDLVSNSSDKSVKSFLFDNNQVIASAPDGIIAKIDRTPGGYLSSGTTIFQSLLPMDTNNNLLNTSAFSNGASMDDIIDDHHDPYQSNTMDLSSNIHQNTALSANNVNTVAANNNTPFHAFNQPASNPEPFRSSNSFSQLITPSFNQQKTVSGAMSVSSESTRIPHYTDYHNRIGSNHSDAGTINMDYLASNVQYNTHKNTSFFDNNHSNTNNSSNSSFGFHTNNIHTANTGNSAANAMKNNNTLMTADVLQTEEYIETKKRIALMMKEFHEKKLHFVATDGSPVFAYQYQLISQLVKQDNQPISNYLQGEMISFITGIDKKKQIVTKNDLFVPVCRPMF